jgi:XTP/dITP diphosphohydrolase
VEEEIAELKEAIAEGNPQHIEEEFGDVLFSMVNYARFLSVDAEHALESTNKKFIKRFTQMEEAAAKDNKFLHDMTLEEMDQLWNQIKANHQ